MDSSTFAGGPDFESLNLFLALCSLVMGMVWGSFFNVCIYRIPARKSIVQPPSHCSTCGTPLRWWQNVPVLGWLMLGGRCACCGQAYGFRYPLVEFLTGILFLAAYLQAGPQALLFFHLVFIGLLVIGIYTDIDHFILPDRITLGGAVFMVAASPIAGAGSPAARDLGFLVDQVAFWTNSPITTQNLPGWVQGLCGSVLGAVVGYGLLWGVAVLGRILFQKEAMGGGDVKLFALIGAYLGAVNSVLILFAASVLGLVLGVYALITHRLFSRDETQRVELFPYDLAEGQAPVVVELELRTARRLREFPFGPHIAVAALLVLLFQADVRVAFHERIDAYSHPRSERSGAELIPGITFPTIRLLGSGQP
jgi:leader peptidase (prepilin peptidase)/N-methyltransferase